MGLQEFALDNAYSYNRSGPIRWVFSHMLRFAHLPLFLILLSIVNNLAYSNIQIYVGRGFDIVLTPGWASSTLLAVALGILAAAAVQGLTGLARNFAVEFLAQKIERDSRDELYANLLGKDMSFHGRQRIGDIMARATNDVRMLNMMFSPGIMLVTDAFLALIVPVVMIGILNIKLLLVPAGFTVFLIWYICTGNAKIYPHFCQCSLLVPSY